MAGIYNERAVDALHAAVSAGFPGQLTAYETLVGLGAGELGTVTEYRKAIVGTDTRDAMIFIDDAGGAYDASEDATAGQRNEEGSVDCAVVMALTSDTDVDAGKLKMRRWVGAMLKTIRAANGSISDAGVRGFLLGNWETATGETQASGQATSATRHYALIEVEVLFHEV